MTTPDELGLDTPTLNDLIRDGAGNIAVNAQVLAQLWDKRWNRPAPAAGTNADTLRTIGAYPVYLGTVTNLPPGSASGSLMVLPSTDTAVTHLWIEYGSNPQLWSRFYAPGPGAWGAWRRIDGANKLTDAGFLGISGDLNDATTPGVHGYWATSTNAPGDNSGVVWVAPVNTENNVVQLAIEYGTAPGVYVRFRGGTWSGWSRIDAGAAAGGGGTGNSPSALKTVPLALSASTATSSETVATGAVRFPLKANAPIPRWRLHIRNHNDRTNTSYPAGASFTGLWAGLAGAAAGAYASAPAQISGPFTLPADGSEHVTPWSSHPIGDGRDVLLSLGWTGAAGPNTSSPAGCYRSTEWSADDDITGGRYTRSAYAPFSWWIEAETPATTPVVAAWGDSITAGTGNDLILHDSFLSQYCRRIGALPVHYAYPGSGMSAWVNANTYQWTRWAHLARADAVIHFMGQNDLNGAGTLAAMQDLYWATIGHLGAHVSQNIYLATITPHANKTTEINSVRKAYNNWLKTLPGAARDVFDFNAAVRNATDDALLPAYDSGDTLHLSTAGSSAVQATITRPVTTERTDRDTGTVALTVPGFTPRNNVTIQRVGPNVYLSIESSDATGTVDVVGLIPAGYRPVDVAYGRCVPYFTGNSDSAARVLVNGTLQIPRAVAGEVVQLDMSWRTREAFPA